METDIRVTHFIPGRIRVRSQRVKLSQDFAQEVENRLAGLDGVRKVETNPLTGSILVEYDPRTLAQPEQRQAARETLHGLFPELNLDQLTRHL